MDARSVELTTHASVVIATREIEFAWIVRVLTYPDRTETDRVDPTLRHALGRIEEREGRVLRVVYNPQADPPRVITAYFDRRLRGTP